MSRLLFILSVVFLIIYFFDIGREINHNNLNKIKLDQELAEKRQKLEQDAVEITRQKIKYLKIFKKFNNWIPGSNRINNVESLKNFRNRLECVTTKGKWELDLTPRSLIKHKQDPLYRKCHKRHQNSVGHQITSVEEEWNLIPESAKYVWETPKEECSMPKINVDQACDLISGLNIFLVGDKSHFQLHELLLDFFHEGPVQCYGESACSYHILCNFISNRDRKKSTMKFIRNDILSTGSNPSQVGIKDLQLPWLMPGPNVYILNKGHHWQDDETFRDSLINTVIRIREKSQNCLIIYRATTIGHLNCQNVDKPLPVPPNATELESLPYHWGDIHRQNLIAKEIIEAVGGVFLDVESIMITRADGHIGGRDCLRWCIPGPADVWLDFLFYTLQELL
ncbi:8118_t:CDS:1 [Dentiscutata erythropus]|uniref:8118_t:CDS:1 n=1 Tax=Dentiscutata erythropus TaxID=1348616 RepID=A0A9N9IQ75_9GLOM|nr:8118_t:CDS:1 [Dentiscutata erythropus]